MVGKSLNPIASIDLYDNYHNPLKNAWPLLNADNFGLFKPR